MWHERDEFDYGDDPFPSSGFCAWVQAGLILFLVALLFVFVMFAPAKAAEVSICGPVPNVVKALAKHGEVPIVEWAEKDGSHRALSVAADGSGGWTLISLAEGGEQACTMRSGVGFDILLQGRDA